MTSTTNLELPFIEGGQAQKHVTHNEALRRLDVVIQIAVQAAWLTTPPSVPATGDRYIVGVGATGAWSGRADDIAGWTDGAWEFLTPRAGWCAWSIEDDFLLVFDGTQWRDARHVSSSGAESIVQLGVNTTASSENRLSVRSNAVLFTDLHDADGGSGDIRLQLSRETSANATSVFFSNAFSGRAEFGLIGTDEFRLKVSADGASWIDALVFDPATGLATLPRAMAMNGVVSPAQITANQNDYAPADFANCAVLRLSSDAARDITGLAGGSHGRHVAVFNTGAFNLTLKAENASSTAVNRFAASADVVLAPKEGVALWYDQTSSRWRVAAIANSGGGSGGVAGPGSSVDARIAVFSGTGGSLLADGGQTIGDIAANATNIAAVGHAATAKTTPVDADEFPLIDSAASYALKRLTWANLKATAKTYFDTLYSTIIRGTNAQTGTSYTLAITDAGNVVTCSNGSAVTVTVPPNSSVAFPAGTQIEIIQTGAGAVTLAQGSGVTINSKAGNKKLGGQHVGVTLLKTATDTWQLMGDLTS